MNHPPAEVSTPSVRDLKLENIISGHKINDDDAAWLRSLAAPAPAEVPQELSETWIMSVASDCGLTGDRLSILFDFTRRVERATRLAVFAAAPPREPVAAAQAVAWQFRYSPSEKMLNEQFPWHPCSQEYAEQIMRATPTSTLGDLEARALYATPSEPSPAPVAEPVQAPPRAPEMKRELPPLDGLGLAVKFHETYERLAPQFGYETRPDTKVFDPDSKNGRLMVAVCTALAQALRDAAEPQGEPR
jgi:hypothetical protein